MTSQLQIVNHVRQIGQSNDIKTFFQHSHLKVEIVLSRAEECFVQQRVRRGADAVIVQNQQTTPDRQRFQSPQTTRGCQSSPQQFAFVESASHVSS